MLYKAALPLCELLAAEAKANNPLLRSCLRKEEKTLGRFHKMARKAKTVLTKPIASLLECLSSHDKHIATILSNLK